MKELRNTNYTEALNSINRVEASPYLISRIRQRIAGTDTLTRAQSWALALSFVMFFAINILAFNTVYSGDNFVKSDSEFEYLLPQNQLY